MRTKKADIQRGLARALGMDYAGQRILRRVIRRLNLNEWKYYWANNQTHVVQLAVQQLNELLNVMPPAPQVKRYAKPRPRAVA